MQFLYTDTSKNLTGEAINKQRETSYTTSDDTLFNKAILCENNGRCSEAISIYEHEQLKDNPVAQRSMGQIFFEGRHDVTRDQARGISLLVSAACNGDDKAINYIARLIVEGGHDGQFKVSFLKENTRDFGALMDVVVPHLVKLVNMDSSEAAVKLKKLCVDYESDTAQADKIIQLCDELLNRKKTDIGTILTDENKISPNSLSDLLSKVSDDAIPRIHTFVTELNELKKRGIKEAQVFVDFPFTDKFGNKCNMGWHPQSIISYRTLSFITTPVRGEMQALAEKKFGCFLSWNGGSNGHDNMDMPEPAIDMVNPFTGEVETFWNSEFAFQIYKLYYYYSTKCPDADKVELKQFALDQFTNEINKHPNTAANVGYKSMPKMDWDGWDTANYQIMVEIIQAKMEQNPDLCILLFATSMVDNNLGYLKTHETWGTGKVVNDEDGKKVVNGDNRLGKCLMTVRDKLLAG